MRSWHASEEFDGVFHEERSLKKHEIDTIVSWVDQRARRGNPYDAPEPKVFSETGRSIRPDLSIMFDEPFRVGDDEMAIGFYAAADAEPVDAN